MSTMLRDRLQAAYRDLQVKNALGHRKDAVNLEELVIETRTPEEEFGKHIPEQSHVQQEQNAESTLQALVINMEELEGMV